MDIVAGSDSSSPDNLTPVNGWLFFTAYEDTHGTELWSSDGTAGGTALVTDINPGSSGAGLTNLRASAGRLFLSAYDDTWAGVVALHQRQPRGSVQL